MKSDRIHQSFKNYIEKQNDKPVEKIKGIVTIDKFFKKIDKKEEPIVIDEDGSS